ncbi:hypothetical protein BDZ90DRAFT_270128 [Jaminaea rosea]|uniref:Bromodomain associated domain-containing protein n=1 Tax=Jaminaea rosea TaxID=1569628 RepID=A0A316UY27_9BASI|nr:hypothetical protein BDZ90DRAFT_270128 [Jaminaea rosea]PWN28803.1 hypothetical protein BDZ90DRAFT_270128 [Jaminaea rosea]
MRRAFILFHKSTKVTTSMTTSTKASSSSTSSRPSTSSSALPGPLCLVQPQLAHLISLYPFTSVPSNTLPLLSEITHHYLQLITRLAAHNARHAGRTHLVVWDIMAALAEVGSRGVDDLMAGWMAPPAESEAAVVRKDWQERIEQGWRDEEAKRQYEARKAAIRQRTSHGRSEAEPIAEMRYLHLAQEEAELYEEFRLIEEERLPKKQRVEDEDEEEIGSLPASPRSINGDSVAGPTHPGDDQGDQPAYIPWYLPPLPSKTPDARSQEQVKEEHAEVIQSEAMSIDEGAPTAGAASGENAEVSATTAPQATSAPAARPNEEQADASSSYFTPPVPYASSSLYANASGAALDGEPVDGSTAAQPTIDIETAASSLPSLELDNAGPSSQRSSTSSLLTALTSLAQSGESPALLPKPSATSANKTRRRLASLISQPNRYEPNDVLYSSLPSRPSCMPFLPSPSHLVTLPESGTGAPRFTPTRPRGRPLSLGSVGGELGGASHPALGYRQPRMAAEVARYLLAGAPAVPQRPEGGSSGGEGAAPAAVGADGLPLSTAPSTNPDGESTLNPSTLYRSLHVYDPAPLRDSAHVERVFRGKTTRGDAANGTGAEGWLKGAHDALKVATGVAGAGGGDGQVGAPKKGGPAGTVVYTWDWLGREPADGTLLPAKEGAGNGDQTSARSTAVGR